VEVRLLSAAWKNPLVISGFFAFENPKQATSISARGTNEVPISSGIAEALLCMESSDAGCDELTGL
jgi:hypothetical protein